MSVTSSGRFVDQQDDEVRLICKYPDIGRDRMGDVLEHSAVLPVRGGGHDQCALSLAHGATKSITLSVLVTLLVGLGGFHLHAETLFRIERRQVVEVDPMTQPIRLVEIDLLDLE